MTLHTFQEHVDHGYIGERKWSERLSHFATHESEPSDVDRVPHPRDVVLTPGKHFQLLMRLTMTPRYLMSDGMDEQA